MIGYSRVVVRGDSAWVSGCTSVVDGEVRHPGDVAAQAREALAGLAAALENAGFALADVVRTRMYLTDISRWEELGRAHGEVFGEIRPATAMIGVGALLHPDMLVEIEADAVRGSGA
jgi:enamine deaminase RidA (YjgF/YER057c/UK114 family)